MASWALSGPIKFYDRSEGLVVCYRPDSGDTHLVNAEAAEVLRMLGRHPLDETRLWEALSLDGVAVESELRQLLADLARVELVYAS